MKVEKRLRVLENRLLSDPVTLYLADGTMQKLYGPKDFMLNLVADAWRGTDLGPGQAAQMDLIRQSVAAREPGGGRMVELLRCMLNAPAEGRGNPLRE
jgi:hypothetical protein